MALQESNENNRTGHHCRDCGLFFESSKSLEVHLQYHKENLLTKWANQANAASIDSSRTDSENNNVKSRREFQNLVAAAADSTDMKPILPTGPGRPNSNSGYPPPASSPFTHPHTPASYSSAPSPYQNDVHRFSPSTNPGPSPSSTSFGFSNGTSEPYQLPFNNYPGNLRSPRSSSSAAAAAAAAATVDAPQQWNLSEPPQEPYLMAANSDFPPGGPPTGGQRSSSPSSSSAFRFSMFNKSCYPLDKNGVSSSSPNSFRPHSPFQCEKCGFICESSSTLSEHVKTVHAPSPMVYNHGSASAFQQSDNFFRPEAIKQEVIQDSPDILDLDSQQKVFRTSEDDSGSATPVSHSVSAMLTPWPNNVKPQQYPQAQPYLVTSTNPPPQNYHPAQNGPIPGSDFQSRNFPPESFPRQSNVPNQSINNNQISNSASPKLTNPTNSLPQSGKGDSWKSNEARRPKTYNCSACNKWFTSSGHLKRHYNTTLHKNAVKQSGQPDPATLPISSHHHPNRDPNYIHSSKTPVGMSNPPPNLAGATKAKKAKSISPQGEANTPSPATSNAGNEGDSSRSNDNIYDRMYDRNGSAVANGTYDRSLQHGFVNAGFDMIQTSQTSAFDRTTPASGGASAAAAFDQRTPPQAFEQRSGPQVFEGRTTDFDGRNQNGYAIQDLNRPGSNPDLPATQGYDYYRYDRLPLHNQQNSTNQVSGQSPNFQAGPSVSPSGGLPICPPSHHSLRTPNPTNIFMGENILMVPASEPASRPQDHHIIPQYISSPTIIGNADSHQNAPLPSFSNFQTFIFQQSFPANSAFDKDFYTSESCQPYPYVTNKSEMSDISVPEKSIYVQDYLPEEVGVGDGDCDEAEEVAAVAAAAAAAEVGDAKPETETIDQKNGFVVCVNKRQMDLLNLKMELDDLSENSDSPRQMAPTSPIEFPTSTNHDLSEPAKRPRKSRAKRKTEESSNVVTSTGSPQPAATKKTVIKCEECDKYFNRICYLTQHNKSFHSGEKPFKCDRCGKRFHSEIRARDHSKKHGGEKPYKCEMCPKSFNHKTDLRRHLCLHSGEKPYACEHCGKGFIRKDHMLKHVDTHRNGKRKFMNKVIDELIVSKVKMETD